MTTAEQSPASPVADSSTFGHSEEFGDTETVPVLCENHEKGVLRLLDDLVVVDTTTEKEQAGRALYRLAFGILLLVIGHLLDARRLIDAASLLVH